MNCLFFCFRLRPTKERKEKISRKTVHQQTKTKKKNKTEKEKKMKNRSAPLLQLCSHPFLFFLQQQRLVFRPDQISVLILDSRALSLSLSLSLSRWLAKASVGRRKPGCTAFPTSKWRPVSSTRSQS